jgi:hypothetical protein
MMGLWDLPLAGVGAVTLNERHPDCVFFVCEDQPDGSVAPVGTAFLAAVPGHDGRWWRYFVTARHVVNSGVPTYIRVRQLDGSVKDEPVGKWIGHSNKEVDVAATPCEPTLLYQAIWSALDEGMWADRWAERWPVPLRLGEDVYFVGLLTSVASMAERSIPMMRSGRIGAWYQHNVPIKAGTWRHIEPTVHILDSYSRGGFSGSPCLADQPMLVQLPAESGKLTLAIGSEVALVGVLTGHFDSSEGGNEGIAVVVPVEAIRETLNQPKLVQWREKRDAEIADLKEREKWANAASADKAHSSNPEFEQFEDLTRKLVRTPKPKRSRPS